MLHVVMEYYLKLCYICLCCGTFVLMIQRCLHSFMLHSFNFVKLCLFDFLKHLIGLIKSSMASSEAGETISRPDRKREYIGVEIWEKSSEEREKEEISKDKPHSYTASNMVRKKDIQR